MLVFLILKTFLKNFYKIMFLFTNLYRNDIKQQWTQKRIYRTESINWNT